MRASVDDPNDTIETTPTSSSVSDFQAVDNTPGILMTLWSLLVKIWWIAFIIFGLAAIAFPYLFPQWSENYKNQLSEMGIAANTAKFIKNARQVNWKDAFNKVNLDNLRLVGTGLHSQFDLTPGLKNGSWYTGQVFIMKDYVKEGDWLRYYYSKLEQEDEADMLSPVTEIDHSNAADYCRSQNGRLPSWDELNLAYYFAFTKKWQGNTGNFLKPNLVFKIDSKHSLWTNTAQGKGFLRRDNFRIFTPGAADEHYEDNGFESIKLSFLCVKDEDKK